MKRTNHPQKIIPGMFLLALIVISSCSDNWPGFRGPASNLIVTEKNLPDTWDREMNIRWTNHIDGDSWTSPVI